MFSSFRVENFKCSAQSRNKTLLTFVRCWLKRKLRSYFSRMITCSDLHKDAYSMTWLFDPIPLPVILKMVSANCNKPNNSIQTLLVVSLFLSRLQEWLKICIINCHIERINSRTALLAKLNKLNSLLILCDKRWLQQALVRTLN